jgi:ankyrin repeat protein
MLLAKKNVDVNMATLRGATPMFIASQGGNVKVVAALLEHPHCDINKPMTQSRVTPFYIACSRRHFPVLEELVKRSDCDINRADRSGLTPLHLAVRNGIVRLAAMLLRRPDCDLNPSATVSWPVNQATGLPTGAKLPPPLISACALNHTGIAMSLLARGALGVGGGDHDGTTFFHVAASHCHLETVNAILAVFPRKDAWHTFLMGSRRDSRDPRRCAGCDSTCFQVPPQAAIFRQRQGGRREWNDRHGPRIYRRARPLSCHAWGNSPRKETGDDSAT